MASFIRPHGVERRATPIFADAIDRLAAAPAPAAERAPAWRFLVWPFLLMATGLAWVVDRLDDGTFHRLRKRAESAGRRVRKRLARAGARWKRYFEEAW